MELIRGQRSELEKRAAKLIADRMSALDHVMFGIVGGSSVNGIFIELLRHDIDWQKVHIFMVDERCVPIDSDESNFKGAHQSFIRQLIAEGKMQESNVHPYHYNDIHEESSLVQYNEEFTQVWEMADRDEEARFDITLLSAGEDGHTASLFPGDETSGNGSIWRDEDGFIAIDNSPKPPAKRISTSRKLLEKTDFGILLFFGEGKRTALKNFLDDNVSLNECPVKIVQHMNDAYVLTDIEG